MRCMHFERRLRMTTEMAFFDATFLAVLPSIVQSYGWKKVDGELVPPIEDRVCFAMNVALEAAQVRFGWPPRAPSPVATTTSGGA